MRIKEFFINKKEYFITSAIIFAIVFSFYLIFNIFPFGAKTIAHYDMMAQTVPLSELVYDFFTGESPLFYTTKTGLGANTFGYLVYFILSPFNLLTLVGGKGNIIYTVNIVFLVKLIFIGCIAIWFIKKYFKNLKTIHIIMLSLLYVFSGYTMFSYTYLSFLDYLIYAPLFVHFFIKLRDNGKVMPLSVIIFLIILSCFSLGCFTLLYLLIIFIGYIFIYTEKEKRKALIIKTTCACLIGIGMSMWLLLPSFIMFTNSSRGLASNFETINPSIVMSTKIGVLITEVISVIFATIYIIKCNKKDRLNKFLIYVALLTIITTICNEVMLVLNGGSIFGYYSRFGFVGAFLTLILASKYFNENLIYNYKKDKFVIFINYFIATVLLIVFILLLVGNVTGYEINGFKNQQISYIGLSQFLVISSPIILIVIYSLINRKKIGQHVNVLLLICTIFLCVFNFYSHISVGINNTNMIKSVNKLSAYINDERVKYNSNSYITFSSPISGFNSIETFSSLVDGGVTNSLMHLGYNTTSNSVKSNSGTILSDIIVGNKYTISKVEINNNYLKFIALEDDYYLYENLYFHDNLKTFNGPISLSGDLIDNQEKLFKAFGGQSQLLKKVNVKFTYENCTYDENSNTFQIIDTSKPSIINIENNYDNNTLLYAYYEKNDDTPVFIKGEASSKSLFEIFKNKDKEFGDIGFSETLDFSNFSFYTLDLEKLNELEFNSSETKVKYNKITSTINLSENSSIMLPYIDIDGYSVYVNGEKTKFSGKFLDFMTLDLEKGENNIEIVFNNPSIYHLLIGLGVGLLLILFALFILKYKDKYNDKFINNSFKILSYIYIYITLFVPIILMLLKLIHLI